MIKSIFFISSFFILISCGYLASIYFPLSKIAASLNKFQLKTINTNKQIITLLPYILLFPFILYFYSLPLLIILYGITISLMALVHFFFPESLKAFCLYLSYAIIYVSTFIFLHYTQTGEWFLPGKDDYYFFKTSIEFVETNFNYSSPIFSGMLRGSNSGYIQLLGHIAYWATLIQENILSNFFVIYILFHYINLIAASLTLVYLRQIGFLLFDQQITRITTILFFLSPTLILYTTCLYRDIVIGLIITATLYYFFKSTRLVSINTLIIVTLSFIHATFRPTSFLLLTFIILYLSLTRSLKPKAFWTISIIFGIIGCVFMIATINNSLFFIGNIPINLERTIIDRQTYNIDNASASSLGASLIKLPFAIRVLVCPLYFILMPIPPLNISGLISSNFAPRYITENLNGLFWFPLAPFFLIGLKNLLLSKKKQWLHLFITILLVITFVSITSLDTRHKTLILGPIYLATALGIRSLINKTNINKITYELSKLISFSPTFLYIFIKYIYLPFK